MADLEEEQEASGEEEGEGGEEEEFAENALTKELAAEGLSLLCKTGNGLAHAYVRMDLRDKGLTEISILNCFVHVRYVDVSGNHLSDISALSALPQLLTIKADNNQLTSAKLQELRYLQVASFAHNKIVTTEGIAHPLLETLNLAGNKIAELEGLTRENLPSLRVLDLHANELSSTVGLALPSLHRLYLASNRLMVLQGLEALSQLTSLHLRDNKIASLDGFAPSMEALQYLNLRGNAVADLSEVQKLASLPYLRALVLAECPVCEGEEYRVEVLVRLRRLERLDKDEFSEDERGDAEEVYQQRQQQQQEGEEEGDS